MKRISIFVSAAMIVSVAAVVPLATEAGAALTTFATTIDSGIVNIAVGGASSSTLTVPQTGRIVDVNVGVRVVHPSVQFVNVNLTSPEGTFVDLSSGNGGPNGPGGVGQDYGNAADCTSTTGLAVFDDDAASAITANVAPFVGSFRPEAPLSGLENQTLNGDWTLAVTESVGFSFDQLVCWTMTITYAGPLAAADSCNQLAWSGKDGTDYLIWAANGDGQGRAELISPGSGTDPTGNSVPAWSPDGTHIAWAGSDGVNDQLWVADPDGTTRVEISSVGLGTDPTGNSDPAWAPDGTQIAWSAADGITRQIWTADPDGKNRTEISTLGLGTDPTANSDPVWSPDGTRIAWWGVDNDNLPSGTQIWVADPDGTNRLEISSIGTGNDPTQNAGPSWSPDSSRIAWYGRDGANPQIYVAASDGTDRAKISTVGLGIDPTANFDPVWSPDGTRIAWSGLDGPNGYLIWVSDPNGANRVDMVNAGSGTDPQSNFTPAWSPDGSRIAWSGIVNSKRQIWAADPDGGNREAISLVELGPDPTDNRNPVWRNCKISCPTAATPFTDLGGAAFAADDIACIYGLGITTGTTLTEYSPAAFVTRGQMAAFLARLWRGLGKSCPTAATPFTDLGGAAFAADDIACIYGLGITTGTTLTEYSPAAFVTRGQMAAFLARLWRKC